MKNWVKKIQTLWKWKSMRGTWFVCWNLLQEIPMTLLLFYLIQVPFCFTLVELLLIVVILEFGNSSIKPEVSQNDFKDNDRFIVTDEDVLWDMPNDLVNRPRLQLIKRQLEHLGKVWLLRFWGVKELRFRAGGTAANNGAWVQNEDSRG